MLNAGQFTIIRNFFSLFHTFNSCMGKFDCFPSDMEKQKRRPCKYKLVVICSFETGKETANALLHDWLKITDT